MTRLLHIASEADWAAAQLQGSVPCPPGGFIHLCTDAQLAFVLDRHFAGRTGLVLVRLDPSGLDVRWEQSEPGLAPFPHLYEALPLAAVGSAETL